MKKTLTALTLLLLFPLAGCHKIQARAKFREAHAEYRNESYVKALEKFQEGLELDPATTEVWRSVGLSALAIYKPGDESPKNIELGRTAADAFQKYLEAYPDDKKVREYYLTTLVNTKRYDEALSYLDQRARQAPAEAAGIQALKISILTQSGRLEDAWSLVRDSTGPQQAESLYTIAVSAWDKAYNDPTLDAATRGKYVDLGLDAIDRAVNAKKDYFEAMVYYNLLYREKAKLQTDALLRADYIAKADEWQQKAIALRKRLLDAEKKAAAKESAAQTS
jgi:tetratricopeptide (TPR) repeat protein